MGYLISWTNLYLLFVTFSIIFYIGTTLALWSWKNRKIQISFETHKTFCHINFQMIQSDWYYTLCAGGRIASSFLRCWSIAGHCGRRTRPWPTLLTTPASFTTGSPQAPRIICSITWKHNLQMSIIIKYIIGSLVSLILKKTMLVNKLVLQKNKFWRI